MARIARVIVPGIPLHVTQRGNRRQQTFFNDADYVYYKDLMAHWSQKFEVDIWVWCLMPNHVHLLAVPSDQEGLSRAIGETHRRFTRHINFRENWRGHLWQERFASFPLDEKHLLAVVRYIEMNPVAAGLAKHPGEYRWSSARAHLENIDDGLTTKSPQLSQYGDWSAILSLSTEVEVAKLHQHERTGRPLGSTDFVKRLEQTLNRTLAPQKPGPKKKKK